jgi:hypothetical protein
MRFAAAARTRGVRSRSEALAQVLLALLAAFAALVLRALEKLGKL